MAVAPGWTAERRWLVICAVAWLLLLPISTWLTMQNVYWWKMAAAPASALLGASTTVLLGALLIKRAERRIADEHRQEWLSRNFEYAILSQHAIRVLAADAAALVYQRISTTCLTHDKRIPDEVLRRDIMREPPLPSKSESIVSELKRSFDETVELALKGPLATVGLQMRAMRRILVLRTRDPDTDGVRLGNLLSACEDGAVAQRIRDLANETLQLSHAVVGADDLEPHEIQLPAMRFLLCAGAMDAAVHRRADTALIVEMVSFFEQVKALRGAMWKCTSRLLEEGVEIGGTSTLERIKMGVLEPLMAAQDAEWKRTRQKYLIADQ